jgi:hypothetical protein
MELFKMTCREVQVLRDDTLERLIQFNSNLKIQYAGIKEGVRKAKELQEGHVKGFKQGNRYFSIRLNRIGCKK